jgi:hypothetical protein
MYIYRLVESIHNGTQDNTFSMKTIQEKTTNKKVWAYFESIQMVFVPG